MKEAYFNIEKARKESKIPENIFRTIKTEAKAEFPHDPMMYELHVLRAIKSKFWEKKPSTAKKREFTAV
jgi:hypothetical protein